MSEELLVAEGAKDRHCSGDIWPAAYELLSFLRTVDLDGKVLELGAGTGFLGLKLAEERPGIEVTCTDHPDHMEPLRSSLALNLNTTVRAEVLDWSNPTDLGQRWDFIVGSDLVYSTFLCQLITELWNDLLDRQSTATFYYAHTLHRWGASGVDWQLHEECVKKQIAMHPLTLAAQPYDPLNLVKDKISAVFKVERGSMPQSATFLLRSAVEEEARADSATWERADQDEKAEIMMAQAISEIDW